jgi:hypothetical protein
VNHLRRGLAICGFVLAALGVALSDPRLVWPAIVALLVSLMLRLILRRPGDGNSVP